MPLTLEKIARLTGVSRSTVSRVINNDPNVRQETRDRVNAVIRQVNFQPNLAARGLAAGRTRVLGIIIPKGVLALFSDPFFPLMIQGISTTCNSLDYSVMLWLVEPEYEQQTIARVIHGGLIDGVIVSSMFCSDSIVDALVDTDFPLILIGRYPNNNRVSFVDVDNIHSSCEAVTYLFRCGYHKVGTVMGPKNMVAGHDRLEGYLLAHHNQGIEVDPARIVEGDFTEEGGYTAIQQILQNSPDTEAVFAASDAMAIGALRALREAGRRVPEDIAVVGFDDMPFAARSLPSLTTIRQPTQRVGAVAAETLVTMIEQNDFKPRQIILPTELVIRASGCRL